MRFVKYSSKEQGPWTSNDNKLMTFDVPLSEDIDHDKSYLILNMGAEDTKGLFNLSFGSPAFDVPYLSCAMVQNSSLKLDNMSSPIEYNQDINLYMANKKHYETGFTEQQALSYFQKSAYYDLKNGRLPTPFLSNVKFVGDAAANPSAKAVYNASNVIIPLSDVLPSFNKISQKMANKSTYQFELDKVHNLFTSLDLCKEPINVVPCNNVTGSTALGNRNLIYTSSKLYTNIFETQIKGGQRLVVRYSSGNPILSKYGLITIDSTANSGVELIADGSLRIKTNLNIWTNATVYTNISIQRAINAVDYVLCANLTAAGKALTTSNNFDASNCPFYVGQRVKIIFGTAAAAGGGGAGSVYNEVIRNIEKIEFTAGGKAVITVDGADDIPISISVLVTGARPTDVVYNINKADLVIFQGQMGVEMPKVYRQLEQMPRNKLANSLVDETYLLNKGTLLTYFMQGSPLELVSYDQNLLNYRINLDNKPTTEVPVVLNSALSEDIKLRIMGGSCKNLLDSLNQDLNERKVIVEQTKDKSMLQLTLKANPNTVMLGNILYMFAIVERALNN